MSPIRVGLVGLSSKASNFGPGAWGRIAHIGTFSNNPDFELVAVVNASVEAAREAIRLNGLPSTTKAYGNIDDLVADPDVDLVVISVRVEKHLELTPGPLGQEATLRGVAPRGEPSRSRAPHQASRRKRPQTYRGPAGQIGCPRSQSERACGWREDRPSCVVLSGRQLGCHTCYSLARKAPSIIWT